MASTKATASTHARLIFLLAAILLAAASVQARRDSRLTPSPATAPSAAAGGRCPPDVVDELGVCVDVQLGLRRSQEDMDRCCRLIRTQVGLVGAQGELVRAGRGGGGFVRQAANVDTKLCLCAAFSLSVDGARATASVNDQRASIVLANCGVAPVPGPACPGPLTG